MNEKPTIDHDKNEFQKVPDYGHGEAFRRQHGKKPQPFDLLRIFLPLLVFFTAMYAWRHWL